MKGQVFVAGAAILIVLLALFRSAAVDTGFEAPTTGFRLDNLESEYRHLVTLSAKEDDDLLTDFSSWMRDQSDEFDAFYILIRSNGGSFTLDIGNYLRASIDLKLNATGASPSETEIILPDKSTRDISFTGGGTVSLTVSYTTPTRTALETITFETGNRTLAFYDIGLRDADGETRRRDIFRADGE